jgi:hypothetical protein
MPATPAQSEPAPEPTTQDKSLVEAFVSFLRAELKTTTAPSAEEPRPKRQKCTIRDTLEQAAMEVGLDVDTHLAVVELVDLLSTKRFSQPTARQQMRALLEKLESITPEPKPTTSTVHSAHLDAIREATDDIQVAIDDIFNAEGAPDLDDIAAVVAANKNIVLLLDVINPPHTPRVQHKYAAELFDEATKRKGQQKPAPV